ncbi:hypothetical protein BDZ89DRAFT_145635 [Hymenopellis radicata]|nr:hypothetical protein BDZ89DRAFT_145635 [Hymenopellis radicata]
MGPNMLVEFRVWRRRGNWLNVPSGLGRCQRCCHLMARVDSVVYGWWRDVNVELYAVLARKTESDVKQGTCSYVGFRRRLKKMIQIGIKAQMGRTCCSSLICGV